MEKLAERYPHLLESILTLLDDASLQNSRQVSKIWRDFVDEFWLVKQLRLYKTKPLFAWAIPNNHDKHSLIDVHEDWKKCLFSMESDLDGLRLIMPLMKDYYHCPKSGMKGYTPLHYAVKREQIPIIQCFISSEMIDVKITAAHGRNLLHVGTSENGDLELMELLLKLDLDVNQPDWIGNTPLHIACNAGNYDLVALLLSIKSIDVNVRNDDGYTPLHYACKNDQNGQVKTVELLLLNRLTLDVNVPNDDGLTPLHLACMYGLTKVVKLLLLEPNIDIDIEDRQGRTPLMLAKQNNHSITIRQFEKGTKTCIVL